MAIVEVATQFIEVEVRPVRMLTCFKRTRRSRRRSLPAWPTLVLSFALGMDCTANAQAQVEARPGALPSEVLGHRPAAGRYFYQVRWSLAAKMKDGWTLDSARQALTLFVRWDVSVEPDGTRVVVQCIDRLRYSSTGEDGGAALESDSLDGPVLLSSQLTVWPSLLHREVRFVLAPSGAVSGVVAHPPLEAGQLPMPPSDALALCTQWFPPLPDPDAPPETAWNALRTIGCDDDGPRSATIESRLERSASDTLSVAQRISMPDATRERPPFGSVSFHLLEGSGRAEFSRRGGWPFEWTLVLNARRTLSSGFESELRAEMSVAAAPPWGPEAWSTQRGEALRRLEEPPEPQPLVLGESIAAKLRKRKDAPAYAWSLLDLQPFRTEEIREMLEQKGDALLVVFRQMVASFGEKRELPQELEEALRETAASDARRSTEARLEPRLSRAEQQRHLELAFALVFIAHLRSRTAWEEDDVDLAREIARVLSERHGAASLRALEFARGTDERNRRSMQAMAEWIATVVARPERYAALRTFLDDGPFAGMPWTEALPTSPVSVLQAAEDFEVHLHRVEGERRRWVVQGLVSGKVRWARLLGRGPADLFHHVSRVPANPHDVGPYGWIFTFFADGERLTLYASDAGEFLFIFHSW